MLNSKVSSELIEASKVLGSFARLSPGGIDISFGLDKTTADDISKSITESVAQGYIATVDISGLNITSDQCYLEIKLDMKDNGIVSDGYMITTAAIKTQIVTPTAAPEITSVPTATPSVIETDAQTTSDSENTDTENTDSDNTETILIWTSIGAAVIITIVIITLLLIKKKNKHQVQNIEPALEQDKSSVQNVSSVSQTSLPKLELYFTKVGLIEGQRYTVLIDKELIVGRDPAKSQFTFAKDDLLSSQHCKITYSNNQLYIEDLNSTNGTFLNGIPLKQSHMLEQDDIIMMGSMELRVNWKKLR
jgi:hypothetical protein